MVIMVAGINTAIAIPVPLFPMMYFSTQMFSVEDRSVRVERNRRVRRHELPFTL